LPSNDEGLQIAFQKGLVLEEISLVPFSVNPTHPRTDTQSNDFNLPEVGNMKHDRIKR
jgi:hypothetical protein